MRPTLVIDGGYDDDLGLYTGTIVVDGEVMGVWVPGDMAEDAPMASRAFDMSADDVPF